MINLFRKRVIGLLAKSSIAVAVVFGMNAAVFIFLQNNLQTSIAQNEAQLALKNSLVLDQYSIGQLKQSHEICQLDPPDACQKFVEDLFDRRSRLQDLIGIFRLYPFSLREDNPLVQNLESAISAVDVIAQKAFNLSFDDAIDRNVTDVTGYLDYVLKLDEHKFEYISTGRSSKQLDAIAESMIFMKAWSENELYLLPRIEREMQFMWVWLWLLIAFEIVLYLSVSISDFWLTNTPSTKDGKL